MFFQDKKDEFKTRRLWIEVCAEFLVTLLYLFLACGAGLPWNNSPPPAIHMAVCSGLSVGTLVMAALHVSGGHLNPVVSVTFMATGRISILKAVLFIAAQSVGAICGAAILYGLIPQESIGSLGVIAPPNNVTTWQAFGLEIVLTYMMMFGVFAATDPDRNFPGYGMPLAIGICVFICLLVGIPSSGGSLNPARSFGPAVVMNSWRDHWVYWVAPIFGGLLGTFTYQLLFAEKRVNQGALQNTNSNAELSDKGFRNPKFTADSRL